MEKSQPNYYAIVPANVRYSAELIPSAKLLYGEITALSNEKGFCWAGDGYFQNLYGVSKTTIQNWLKSLEDNYFIKREVIYKEGSKEILHRYIRILVYPIQENLHTPIQENLRDNNTSFNTTVNNTNNKDKVDSKNESDYTSPKTQQFQEIWEMYPSARRRNKKGCKAKFDKVVKCQADIDLIRNDLTRYIEYTIKSNTESSYIATSQTYFNQERWNDGNSYEVANKPQKQFYGNKAPVRKETLPQWASEEVTDTPMSAEDEAALKKQLAEMRAGGRRVNERAET